MKSILLDTNCYSFLVAGDREIYKIFKQSEITYISIIVQGELFAGFEGGSKKNENVQTLSKFLRGQKVELLKVSQKAAQIYGKISFELNRKGTPIPTNDVWIASQTIETDSTLITYDEHFLKIKGLKIWKEL